MTKVHWFSLQNGIDLPEICGDQGPAFGIDEQ